MEKKNIFLGKLNKKGCYINDGKYGYFLTCDKKIIRYLNGSHMRL
jgi:hypothetical protein